MVARDIMSGDVVTIRPEDPMSKVANLMMQHRYGALPVVAEKIGQLGLLPESSRFHGFEEDYIGAVPVARVMSSEPVQVSEDEPVAEVARKMLEYDISSLPVVREGKLVGIISRADLVEAIVHPSLGGGQR